MSKIEINLKPIKNREYNIFIENGINDKLINFLRNKKIGLKYAIITDEKVAKLFGKTLQKALSKKSIKAELFTFPAGEKAKNFKTVTTLAEKMIKKGFTRKDAIIALGGGVTGDLAGFLASIFMRKIPYIQIPTTLLGMVDSSIGGKTGVDLMSGKNLLGTFYHPKAVFIGIDYLKNLPETQIKNGMAEVIKYAIIKDKTFFEYIEKNIEKILQKEEKHLTKVIKKSIEIKKKIIEEDEHEKGKRIILNYGHTYGHAIEKKSNYKLLHGYAISIGMIIANEIAIKAKILQKKEAERIKKLLLSVGLPIFTMKKPTTKDIASDKKRIGNFINLIVPTKIGKVKIYKISCK